MNVKEVSKDDINDLKEIAKNAIHGLLDVKYDLKQNIVDDTLGHIDRNIVASNRVFLKYKDSEISGFVLVQEYWNLSDLFVSPSKQGRGIGRRLIDEVKVACISKGIGFIRVNSSLNAEGFYRKMGFVTFAPKIEVPDFVVPLIYKFKIVSGES